MKKVWSWLESNRGPIFHNLTLLTIRPPYALITLNFINILIRNRGDVQPNLPQTDLIYSLISVAFSCELYKIQLWRISGPLRQKLAGGPKRSAPCCGIGDSVHI